MNNTITDYAVEMYCELNGKVESMKKRMKAATPEAAYSRACKMFPDWTVLSVQRI